MQVRAPASSATQSSWSALCRAVSCSLSEATLASRLASRSSAAFTAVEIGSTIIQVGTSDWDWALTMETPDVNASARNATERPRDTFARRGDDIMMTPVDGGSWWHQFTPVGEARAPRHALATSSGVGWISEPTSRSRAHAGLRKACRTVRRVGRTLRDHDVDCRRARAPVPGTLLPL